MLEPQRWRTRSRTRPAAAGEGIFGITLTETTSSSGVFRNTAGILAEVEPAVLDAIFQSFDGALIQATYTDPNDGADVSVSNIATLRTTPEAATVVIGIRVCISRMTF